MFIFQNKLEIKVLYLPPASLVIEHLFVQILRTLLFSRIAPVVWEIRTKTYLIQTMTYSLFLLNKKLLIHD